MKTPPSVHHPFQNSTFQNLLPLAQPPSGALLRALSERCWVSLAREQESRVGAGFCSGCQSHSHL